MEKEIFNNYSISNTGIIKSKFTGKEMKQYISNVGYSAVRLTIEKGKTKLFHVHVLIAIAFLDYSLSSNLVVDHKNNIRTDNRLENLQLVTRRLNNTKEFTGKVKYPGVHIEKGRRHYRARIKNKDKYLSLGSYLDPKDAYRAYMKSLKEIDIQAYNYYKDIFGE